MSYSKEFVTGKNSAGVQKINDGAYHIPDEDILCLDISEEEADYIDQNMADWAWESFEIIMDEYEFDEISNDQIDAFLEKIGDDKDKVPCLYEALTTAKRVGGDIQICF